MSLSLRFNPGDNTITIHAPDRFYDCRYTGDVTYSVLAKHFDLNPDQAIMVVDMTVMLGEVYFPHLNLKPVTLEDKIETLIRGYAIAQSVKDNLLEDITVLIKQHQS